MISKTSKLDKYSSNFYYYINNKWCNNNKLPNDHSIYNIFTISQTKVNKKLKKIIESNLYPLFTKVYNGYLDDNYRNNNFVVELKNLIKNMQYPTNINNIILDSINYIYINIDILYALYVDINIYNNKEYIIYIKQPSLILPKDYYLNKKYNKIIDSYKNTIKNIYIYLFKFSIKKIDKIIKIILDIEISLANILLDNDKMENIKHNHILSIDDIKNKYQYFDIDKIIESISKLINKELNIKNIIMKYDDNYNFFINLRDLLNKFSLKKWKIYFIYRIIIKYIIYGDEYLNEIYFNMFNRILIGQDKMKEKTYLALIHTCNLLSEYVSNIYYQYFLSDNNNKLVIKYTKDMIYNIIQGAKCRIKKIKWLTNETKYKAIDKLNNIDLQIGYNIKNYNSEILEKKISNNLLKDSILLIKFNIINNFDLLNKKVDINTWDSNCYEVNAYYNPAKNQIVFPAAILQPSFININKSDLYNYAKLGSIIGHEIIHSLDNNGAKFDKIGNINNWWNKKDKKEFSKKVNSIIDIYDKEGINGTLTAGENIADFGAIIMSLEGIKYKYKRNLNIKELRYFYKKYAKLWKYLIKKELKNIKLLTDPHSFPELRVNIPLKHQIEFQKAYNIKQNTYMYIPESKMLNIW